MKPYGPYIGAITNAPPVKIHQFVLGYKITVTPYQSPQHVGLPLEWRLTVDLPTGETIVGATASMLFDRADRAMRFGQAWVANYAAVAR